MVETFWRENKHYKKGDIVYLSKNGQYFICSIEHMSDNTTCPSHEDIYWVLIHSEFITQWSINHRHSAGILFSPYVYETVATKDIISLSPPPVREQVEESRERKSIKRKIQKEEKNIKQYKKQRTQESVEDLREKLMLLDVDVATKSFIVDKYDNVQTTSGSDYAKGMNWLKTVVEIPYGKHKPMKVNLGDSPELIESFFKNVKNTLDKSIYGLEDVKQEILEFVARKISNPDGKGEVLALCGSAGCGKTRLLKSLAEALDLPFFQINCGGLNDVSVITGHSETYVGSKPGKIVEILMSSGYMNPIIYLDEIDKIGEKRSEEINGVLTHLLDEEQNNSFQDTYLSNVPLDLSKALFVIAFNDLSKVDSIVSDRMKIIFVDQPSLQDKVTICTEKLLPEIIQNTNKNINVNISKEVVEYIVLHKCDKEIGVRQLKKMLEKVINRLNYDILIGEVPLHCIEKNGCEDQSTVERESMIVYNITKRYVDNIIKKSKEDKSYLSMYV